MIKSFRLWFMSVYRTFDSSIDYFGRKRRVGMDKEIMRVQEDELNKRLVSFEDWWWLLVERFEGHNEPGLVSHWRRKHSKTNDDLTRKIGLIRMATRISARNSIRTGKKWRTILRPSLIMNCNLSVKHQIHSSYLQHWFSYREDSKKVHSEIYCFRISKSFQPVLF